MKKHNATYEKTTVWHMKKHNATIEKTQCDMKKPQCGI
jgi:hypothetical protein